MKFYCKVVDRNRITPSIFYLITSHHPPCQLNRTWEIFLGGHRIFICTRCLGQYLGLLVAFLLTLFQYLHVTAYGEALLYFGLFPLPATLDWFSQTMRWRESINSIRFFTGCGYGVSLGVCFGSIWMFNLYGLLFALLIYSCYLLIIFYLLRHFDVLDDYLAPYEQFVSDSA